MVKRLLDEELHSRRLYTAVSEKARRQTEKLEIGEKRAQKENWEGEEALRGQPCVVRSARGSRRDVSECGCWFTIVYSCSFGAWRRLFEKCSSNTKNSIGPRESREIVMSRRKRFAQRGQKMSDGYRAREKLRRLRRRKIDNTAGNFGAGGNEGIWGLGQCTGLCARCSRTTLLQTILCQNGCMIFEMCKKKTTRHYVSVF